MITLADKMKVIQMHLTGYSNRKTIGKYVAEYEAAQAAITSPGAHPTRFGRWPSRYRQRRHTRRGNRRPVNEMPRWSSMSTSAPGSPAARTAMRT